MKLKFKKIGQTARFYKFAAEEQEDRKLIGNFYISKELLIDTEINALELTLSQKEGILDLDIFFRQKEKEQ